MRIRGRKPSSVADCSLSSSSPSPSSSSSSSSYQSPITAPHSLASSKKSSNSCPSLSLMTMIGSSPRCQGLDLLVKAIHQVTAGSVVGVPYIQRRVTIRRRRRRRCMEFDAFLFDELSSRKVNGLGGESLGS
ncbi:hypothetical protein PHJA_000058500 [Phtheirospermum japonicum]|uniref:Uncharacterized protein n=1 Tax=Phtheirospermum japonicum TaxID=374723 RepID=A0A830AX20_9LAMI|nr:hypothetical protein PHJA_000058500 [Phtheirospermum japonicum]